MMPETTPGLSRRIYAVELLVFLFLIVPSMLLSFLVVRQGGLSFVLTAWATIARDLALVCLVAYFLWRNRESRRRIGWTFRNGASDVVLGIVLFIPTFYATGLLELFLRHIGLSAPATPLPKSLTAYGSAQMVLAGFLVVVVAIAEETIFRGYLVRRFTDATGSVALGVILSSFIFSLGHGYEGTAGVATVGTMGLIFALVYIWRQSLVAPITMHFLQDFIGLVVVPLFSNR